MSKYSEGRKNYNGGTINMCYHKDTSLGQIILIAISEGIILEVLNIGKRSILQGCPTWEVNESTALSNVGKSQYLLKPGTIKL